MAMPASEAAVERMLSLQCSFACRISEESERKRIWLSQHRDVVARLLAKVTSALAKQRRAKIKSPFSTPSL
jgi:hypothetical protein